MNIGRLGEQRYHPGSPTDAIEWVVLTAWLPRVDTQLPRPNQRSHSCRKISELVSVDGSGKWNSSPGSGVINWQPEPAKLPVVITYGRLAQPKTTLSYHDV